MFKKDNKINCEHASMEDGGIMCAIGLYGGEPKERHCLHCLRQGHNNSEYVKELQARKNKSHPPRKPRVSGCCDSAENPPT